MPVVTDILGPGGPVWCVLVAAGSGRRYGGAKQFESIAGRRVLDRSLDTALAACDGVVLVVSSESVEAERRLAEDRSAGGDVAPAAVVAGGATRSESVRRGLDAVPDDAAVVVVHDAARPLATPPLFSRVVRAVVDGAAAVVPVVPVVDTIRRTDGSVVDRDELRAVQTPQAFDAASLRAAHADGSDATDDASLVQAAGGNVVLVDGDVRNVKLTTPEDRLVIEAYLAAGPVGESAPQGPGGGDS